MTHLHVYKYCGEHRHNCLKHFKLTRQSDEQNQPHGRQQHDEHHDEFSFVHRIQTHVHGSSAINPNTNVSISQNNNNNSTSVI